MIACDALDRARAYVARIPGAVSGQRGHDRTYRVACLLWHGFALSEHAAMSVLQEFNQRCLPPWNERELRHKLQSAMGAQEGKPRGYLLGQENRPTYGSQIIHDLTHTRAEPCIDPTTACENFLRGFRCGELDLLDASPVAITGDWHEDGILLCERVFQRGELVNVVTEFRQRSSGNGKLTVSPVGLGTTMERDALLARVREKGPPSSQAGAWIRMNPMDGKGVADSNVTAFRHVLVEFDDLPQDIQLSVLARLPIPISGIMTSGGRSVHAWVRVEASDANAYRSTATRLLSLLSRFGADQHNSNPARLSRLPGVRRVLGAAADGRQRLVYLNPTPKQQSIL